MASTREKSLGMDLKFWVCLIEYIVMALVERENSRARFFLSCVCVIVSEKWL